MLTFKQFLRDFLKGIVALSGIADDDESLDKLGEAQLGNHILVGEHPLTVIQLCELLIEAHILQKVHIALLGQCQRATAYMIARVLENI